MNQNKNEQDILFDNLPDVLTVQQVRQVLGIGRTAVYKLVEQKQIRCFKIGNAYKIPKTALIEFIQQSCINNEAGV